MFTFSTDYDPSVDDEIPYSEPPDLISALLSFDVAELSGYDERPEDMLVRKACELKKWKFEGSHPRFLIENWIEVVVSGQFQGSARILNSRAHLHLNPFTLDCLIQEVGKLCLWLKQHQTHPDFDAWLLAAYDEIADSTGEDVPLHEVYRLINARQPGYRREAFGVDLGRTLGKIPMIDGRRVRLSYTNGPLTQRFALCLNPKKSAQLADRIRIEAGLQALDI